MEQPKYHINIFWSDEDGGYIANVPALRYCSAFGETYEEALREVLVAMELHLDTMRELDRQGLEATEGRLTGGIFRIYLDEHRVYRWLFFDADNRMVADSGDEGYRSEEECVRAIELFTEQASLAEIGSPAT